jgi:ABC-type uncharacterized transport system permease subunit
MAEIVLETIFFLIRFFFTALSQMFGERLSLGVFKVFWEGGTFVTRSVTNCVCALIPEKRRPEKKVRVELADERYRNFMRKQK